MAFVQKANSGALAGGSSTYSTAAFASSVTAGNFLWAFATWGDSGTVAPTSVTINGQTATAVGSKTRDTSNGQSAQLFYVENATGGSTTGGTINFGATADFVGLHVFEESGVATSSSADGHGEVYVSSAGTTGTTSSFTPSADGALIVVGIADSSGTMTAVGTPTATNATLTKRETTGTVEMSGASGSQTTAADAAVTWTWTGTANGIICAAAFKAAGGGGSSPVLGGNHTSQTFLSMNSLGGFR